MAQAGYRVRIQQPDPGEAGVLATMIAPFVDLDVEHLEDKLRSGPAVVGDGLERREAEQLVRLFARLGAHAELIEPGQDDDNDEEEEGDEDEEGDEEGEDERLVEPTPLDRTRQTQPFDARALRDALLDGNRAQPPVRDTLPLEEVSPRESTQPFNSRTLRRALAAAMQPSSEAPPTRPLDAEEIAGQAGRIQHEGPPKARMRGRPGRPSRGPQPEPHSEPPPRALPGMGPPGLPPPDLDAPPLDAAEVGLGSFDTASLAFLPEPPPTRSLGERLTPPEMVTPSLPSGPVRALQEPMRSDSAAPESAAEVPETKTKSGPTATSRRHSAAPVELPRTARNPSAATPPVVAAAPVSMPPPPSTAPRPRQMPRSLAPVTRPIEIDELPPPRPSGGHSVPDRVRAAAIRERITDARHPWAHHRAGRAAAFGLLPGMGQLYNGQRGRAIGIALGSLLIFPWIFGIFDAWKVGQAIRDRRHPAPDPVARKAAVPGLLVIDFAVLVALSGAIWLLSQPPGARSGEPVAPVTAAPVTQAPITAAPATTAPPTAPASAGPRPLHELMAEGRTHCGEGRFVECERLMLEIIARRPEHIEAHRLLVDAQTQRKARGIAPPSAP